jgi:zinc transport system ATP-binding protein
MGTGPGDAIVTFRGVTFAYDGAAKPAVEAIDLTVREREFVCLIGPNGGGKSTVLKLLLGLLQPDAGEIRVFGLPPERARLRLGYMPQHLNFDSRFPVSVLDIVLMGRLDRSAFGPFRAADREAAHLALHEVGLDGFGDRQFSDLSGGQRQRVLIARALACEPELLLLDEPTANVDQAVESQFFEALSRFRERMAIIMVSHDLGVVSSLAENVICVNRDAHTHPTTELTGKSIEELYGIEMQAVHHRHGECHDHHQ